MPHNFKIIIAGAQYISKEGSDPANIGTDPNTPRATTDNTLTNTIFGAGVYKGALAWNTASVTRNMYFDGKVVFNITGASNISVNSGFRNVYGSIMLLNGYTLTAGGTILLSDIELRNGVLSAELLNCTRNIFESISGSMGVNSNNFTSCRIFNSTISFSGTPNILNNSYVDSATIITWNSFATDFNAGRFTNNNFQGILNVNGVLYELKQDSDGNAINPNPAIADIATVPSLVGGATAVYVTRKNFSQDPQFLNIEKRDYFSVAPISPMLFADSTGIGNIANVRVATVVKASDTEFADGDITTLTTSAGDLVLDPPNTTGQVTSLPIEAFPIAQPIRSLDIAKILNFNSAEVIGTAENNNVVTVENFSDGTAGANPRRLTYEMRWTDASAMPSVDADWTCQNYFPISGSAGDWFKFEQDVKPLVDVNGLGNGDPDFNSTGAVGIKAKWLQIRITILNGIG